MHEWIKQALRRKEEEANQPRGYIEITNEEDLERALTKICSSVWDRMLQ